MLLPYPGGGRWDATRLLEESDHILLEPTQTSSGQFSVLLTWRVRSHTWRGASTGHMAWEIVSLLFRVFCLHHRN